ncbi:hypothetical protein C481_07956 [Natrialba asiatica DSM 12278]|uniref:Uncharacterized protein n=1 Tax=Natrialba asiatica (strain ATCC 700177 / DSM 12278 / JCM 9576 / FERM P-10747 / NBRC 102637 / 172P1) TaxID=29540 RepID=M0AVL7_NATA1|nr:hypothetical protein C481_07956 [Natrialba asiatica DSM 12278]
MPASDPPVFEPVLVSVCDALAPAFCVGFERDDPEREPVLDPDDRAEPAAFDELVCDRDVDSLEFEERPVERPVVLDELVLALALVLVLEDELVLELDAERARDRESEPELRPFVARLLRRLPSPLPVPVFVFVRCFRVRCCFVPVLDRDDPLLVSPLEFSLEAAVELVSSVSVSAQISGEGMPLVRFAT